MRLDFFLAAIFAVAFAVPQALAEQPGEHVEQSMAKKQGAKKKVEKAKKSEKASKKKEKEAGSKNQEKTMVPNICNSDNPPSWCK